MLATRGAELQCCQQLQQSEARSAECDATAFDSSARQHLDDDRNSSTVELPLDKDDVLDDHVFTLVGGGDHLYIGGVNRRWRSRYMQHCVQSSASELDGRLVTRHRSVLMSESRLQWALSLSVADWTFDTPRKVSLLCELSTEPEKVMALMRVHGVPWSTALCTGAAAYNKLALLQWLHSHACPWDEQLVLYYASMGGSVAMLEWLQTATTPRSANTKETATQQLWAVRQSASSTVAQSSRCRLAASLCEWRSS
jgi:hypothetical protein